MTFYKHVHTEDDQIVWKIKKLNENMHKQAVHINVFSIMVNSQKGLSAIMELILFEILHFEGVRGTFLLITFSFLIAEMVA